MTNRKIIAVVDDMFFASKIRATAESLAVDIKFVRTIDQLSMAAREGKPDLIIVDLHSQKVDAVALAQTIKSTSELKSISLLGFFSHVETDLQRKAVEAGFDTVIPRSVFSRDLPRILNGE
jgi:CheY-like chemotaxis protein